MSIIFTSERLLRQDLALWMLPLPFLSTSVQLIPGSLDLVINWLINWSINQSINLSVSSCFFSRRHMQLMCCIMEEDIKISLYFCLVHYCWSKYIIYMLCLKVCIWFVGIYYYSIICQKVQQLISCSVTSLSVYINGTAPSVVKHSDI